MDEIYTQIKAKIINEQRDAQRRIRPEELADELRVSTTPVRDALKLLAREKLVTNIPNTGFFTKPVSEREMRDLFNLQWLLIDGSLRVIARNDGLLTLNASGILSHGRRQLRNCPPQSAAELADAFFLQIVRQSGNADAVDVIRNINERSCYFRLKECAFDADAVDDLASICETYYRRETEALRSEYRNYHDRRLKRLPRLISKIRHSGDAGPYADSSLSEIDWPGGGVS